MKTKEAKPKRISRMVTGGVLSLAMLMGTANPAAAHDLGNDSVDDGEIRYEDYTSWDNERIHAISTWNAEGCVNIAPDIWSTNADLEIRDYTNTSTSTLAYWQGRVGADLINFNNHWFNQMTANQRKKTAIHELGHALRFGHTSISNSVMRQGIISQTTLGAHDISDYDAQWC